MLRKERAIAMCQLDVSWTIEGDWVGNSGSCFCSFLPLKSKPVRNLVLLASHMLRDHEILRLGEKLSNFSRNKVCGVVAKIVLL